MVTNNCNVYEGDTEYTTCDLYKAAFFASAGCKMQDQFRDKTSKRVYFVFEKTEIMSDLEMRYFKRDAKVDALTFGDNVKSLKSLCHNVKKIGSIAE
jgi:hypothetical protein